MKLIIRMEDRHLVNSPAGFTSNDGCERFMERMFEFLELPYKKPFVCSSIAVDSAKNKVGPLQNRPGVKPPWKPVDNFGPNAFILSDSAIGKVRVVCAGDFQNLTLALLDRILSGIPLADVKALARSEMFMALPMETTREQIEDALDWANRNKGDWPYAEARVFQPIRTGDGSWA